MRSCVSTEQVLLIIKIYLYKTKITGNKFRLWLTPPPFLKP